MDEKFYAISRKIRLQALSLLEVADKNILDIN